VSPVAARERSPEADPTVSFHSILFDRDEEGIDAETPREPAFFGACISIRS
jgi:hypothetical protein